MTKLHLKSIPPKTLLGTLIMVIFISSITGYFLWQKEEEKGRYKGATVEVERVRKGSIDRKISAVGSLAANESVVLKPEVSGTVTKIHFKGGDVVEKGDPLITIDDRRYKAQTKEVEAKLKLARINYERKKSLFEKSATAQAKLDEAQSQLAVAEAEADLARLKLSQTVVKAPFDGIAGLKMISIGDSVNEQKELLSFVDVDPMKIDFKVPGNYVQLLSIGQKVTIQVDGFGERKFKAKIDEIDARIDPQTHSLSVRASVSNKKGLLKPGLFGRVKLVAGTRDDTLLVPAAAVDISGDEEFVYRVVKRRGYNVIEQVTVTAGLRTEDTIEIVQSTLKEGDVLVVSGQVKIQDSSIVRPIGLEEDEDEGDTDEDEKDGGEEKKEAEPSDEEPDADSDSEDENDKEDTDSELDSKDSDEDETTDEESKDEEEKDSESDSSTAE